MSSTLFFVSESRCSLGEGLQLGGDDLAWVDIDNDCIFLLRDGKETRFPTQSKPSVIFRVMTHALEFGSDQGIFSLDLTTGEEHRLAPPPLGLNEGARSNDGCLVGGKYFLGFMSTIDPSKYSGAILYFSGSKWHIVDEDIGIPNTFVSLAPNELLISDSGIGVIWHYIFDENWVLKLKQEWLSFSDGAPDGGVLVRDKLYVAVWDAGCVECVDIHTKERSKIEVPVLRPTNCIFSKSLDILFVTSARQGLSPPQLASWPLSGATLGFKIN